VKSMMKTLESKKAREVPSEPMTVCLTTVAYPHQPLCNDSEWEIATPQPDKVTCPECQKNMKNMV
jgi:hypothetical protein